MNTIEIAEKQFAEAEIAHKASQINLAKAMEVEKTLRSFRIEEPKADSDYQKIVEWEKAEAERLKALTEFEKTHASWFEARFEWLKATGN